MDRDGMQKLISDKIMTEVIKQKYDCRTSYEKYGYTTYLIYYSTNGPDEIRFKIHEDMLLEIRIMINGLANWKHFELNDPNLFEKAAESIIHAINHRCCELPDGCPSRSRSAFHFSGKGRGHV